jgi:hypothetical protein
MAYALRDHRFCTTMLMEAINELMISGPEK